MNADRLRTVTLTLASVLLALLCSVTVADEPRKIPVIVDTDIGSYADDPFALGLVLSNPEFVLRGVTTVGRQADDRAWMVCRFLTQCGRGDVPVARGAEPDGSSPIDWQIQYRRHPAAIFNRTLKPDERPAHEVLHDLVSRQPGQVTLLALGPLTNVARLLREHPQSAKQIRQIVLMGGAIHVGYSGKPPVEAEWNIKTDIAAARAVLASGIPLTVVPLDAGLPLRLTPERRKQLFEIRTPTAFQVQNLLELWETEETTEPVTLYDVAAVAAVIQEPFFKWHERRLVIDDAGRTLTEDGRPNCRVPTTVDVETLLTWMILSIRANGEPVLPRPPANQGELVERTGFPARVHVFEDYETNIEKRWWMCGKIETRDVPPGSRRACRAVLTQDFDDLQGDAGAMYRAVIFNPVPGPPMGPRTRLSFRYKLRGTDTLWVQIYSLSNGYHRCLSVAGLTQDAWREATVDMTRLRRPDGSGGPLSADERIDDIQFYVDPRAELLIDDIVLYEAADDGETRPFPKGFVFTGWFDTGKQGQEWPGDFEILSHDKPRTWKFARSVPNAAGGHPGLRLSLRGERPLRLKTGLTFDYRLRGADSFKVELVHQGKVLQSHDLADLVQDEWTDANVQFDAKPEATVFDEVRWIVPAGGRLHLDEVLLFEP